MHNTNHHIVQQALQRLRTRVLKLDILTHFLIVLLSLLIGFVLYQIFILLEIRGFNFIEPKNWGLSATFILWIILLILGVHIGVVSNRNWRLWVLKHIHYLQDFVAIRKFAIQRKYIEAHEKWLSEEFIQKKYKGLVQQELLDKLELFEYAYNQDFEKQLPEKLSYFMSKNQSLIAMLWSGFFIFLFLGGLFIAQFDETDHNPFNSYTTWVYVFAMIGFCMYLVLKNAQYYFYKGAYLELDQYGVKSKTYRDNTLIPWKHIQKIAYTTKSAGDEIVHYLYIYFIYEEHYPKPNKDYHRVAINGFRSERSCRQGGRDHAKEIFE